MHPDYLYFWYHLNDHSSASTLGILMRIPHNQDMICIFVVFEAQLLAILLAKDIGSSRLEARGKASTMVNAREASRDENLSAWQTAR